jgi:hypothetical protein
MKRTFLLVFAVVCSLGLEAQPKQTFDYSYVGYRLSTAAVPDAPVKAFVPAMTGDASATIQRAIDYVSQLKPDRRTGLRGAVLLDRGTYSLSTPLRISASGVVLRGKDRKETVLYKKGVDRGAVVYLEGRDDRQVTDTISLASSSVPLGERWLTAGKPLREGDEIMVFRPSTKEWIARMGCDNYGGGEDLGFWGWHPGDIDLWWSRSVVAAEGNRAELDAPLSMALDDASAQCLLLRYSWPGRLSESGVEHLSIVSDYDHANPADENHAWEGVSIAAARNCWVRQVVFRSLAGSAVIIQPSASQITVEDCQSYAPVSEIGGLRRRTFLTLGEKCLFMRCFSEQGINDFSAGYCAPGPNAFVQCESRQSQGFSGSSSAWATGLLFDNVDIDGNDILLTNLKLQKYGAGWNTSNSLLYQCNASTIVADSVPGEGNNEVYGCWAKFVGTGRFEESNNHVKPWSHFIELLSKRMEKVPAADFRMLVRNTGEATSPTIEQAAVFALEARKPRITIEMFIDSAQFLASVSEKGAKVFTGTKQADEMAENDAPRLSVQQGKLLLGDRLFAGRRHDTPWWNGRVRTTAVKKATYALTRFVPGQEGQGLTDRVDSVIAAMQRDGSRVFKQNYGLWYDRRRDDHERVRRIDGDVWAPFYEQPVARTGQGKAWDGLSLYDISKPNTWYFARLHDFAKKAEAQGLVLLNEHFFQHNILEAGAHWVDCPWRTANNVNGLNFPEPVPFAGDKRVFMASYFYDLSDQKLRDLHERYIRMQLDAFRDCPNVIHSIGEEFTGPYDFVRFWLQTVAQWERDNHQKVLVSLNVNKDVQDSILADSQLRQVVDMVTIEQWFYHSKGFFAPPGGVNMAPRQYQRHVKIGKVTFDNVYRAVSECRQQYPDKAIVYAAKSYPEQAWAAIMAGGSCPALPLTDTHLLKLLAGMQPKAHTADYSTMTDQDGNLLLYVANAQSASSIPLPKGRYRFSTVDAQTGQLSASRKAVTVSADAGTWTAPSSGIFLLEAQGK